MALFQPNALISEIRGKLGNYVFSRNLGGSYIREIGNYTDAASSEQLAIREFLNKAVQFWQHMNNDCKLAWSAAAQSWNKKVNHFIQGTHIGYNYFISSFIRKCITEGFPFNNLVVNGDFSSDSNWLKGAGWTINTNRANKTTAVSSDLRQLNVLSSIYDSYFFSLDMVSYTSGVCYFYLDSFDSSRNLTVYSVKNVYKFSSPFLPSSFYININGYSSPLFSVDNVIVMQASQYPSDIL
jgi:hypothetical protein